jgi:small subunit ribosomal protein S9
MIETMNNSIYNAGGIKEEAKSIKNITAFGMGKRKRAKALAQLKPGSGVITVNGLEFQRYFSHPTTRGKIMMPLELTDTVCLYDINLKIQGGGISGQTEAAIPAISKALIQINPEWRTILAKNLCLKHDPRNVEPKKPGRIKARKGYVYNRR